MPTPKKHLQKWRRREKQDAISSSIYPHYHCMVCDGMLEKGEAYDKILRKTDRSYTYKYFCSKECYEKAVGKPKEKRNLKKWLLYIGLAAGIGVAVVLILIFVVPYL